MRTGTSVVWVPAIVILVAGCGDDIAREGAHYQYVVSELRIPINNKDARANGLDLNGDRTVDNQLGMVFGTLNGVGLGVASTAQEALLRGGLVMLADLQTTGFEDTELTGFVTYLGGDPDPPPCVDPMRLETCGQHLRGTGRFSIDPDSASDLASAPITAGVYLARVGTLPIEIAIDPAAPIRLDLRAARVQLTGISDGHASGILGGGIIEADIAGVLVPQAAAQMNRIVGAECGQPGGSGPCGCIGGERGAVLQTYFDDDDDCAITLDEVGRNSITQTLFSPDIMADGERALSFGVGIELVTATFE